MSSSAITGPIFTDVRRSPSGTAAAPSWSFNASQGTGVYLVSADVLGLSTAGVQRVVVDASGNVGIGTGSPQDKIHINSGSGGSITLQGQYEFGAENYNLRLLNDGTTRGYLSQTPAAGGVQLAEGQTYSGSGNYRADGTTAAAINMQGGIITFTTNSGLVAAGLFSPTERMRIDASGNLLVGTTSGTIGGKVEIGTTTNSQVGYGYYYNAASPNGAGFYVNSPQSGTNTANWYAFYSRVAGADRFFVTGAGVISASNTSVQPIASDVNLKQDIVDYDKGLNEVLKMKPRYFSWKAEPDRKDIGFIAQEMDEALPGSMVENKDGNKTYRVEWYPILVKAIQEQQEIISALEARLAALEAK